MNPGAKLLACACLVAAALATTPAHALDAPLRISQSVTPEERAAIGLDRLSSDQIAVLDALYRRDLVAQSVPRKADAPTPPDRFSQRLTLDEHRNAGLLLLNNAELAALDAAASRSGTATLARTMLAQPVFVPVSQRARLDEVRIKNKLPEIHGSFTLGMAMGSGGYSERFGGMTLTYEDPVRNFAVSVSYSESHVKGGSRYILRDPAGPIDGINRIDSLYRPDGLSRDWGASFRWGRVEAEGR